MFKKSAVHNLSHSFKASFKMGQILPIAAFDVVPGDRIDHRMTALLRTQPLLAPLMHLVDVDIHVFNSPDRLAWENSEDFQSGGDDGLDESVMPYMMSPASTGYAIGSLADYLGIPPGVPDLKHSALPFRHYNMIYNAWYRDSQLQAEIPIDLGDGEDTTTPKNLLFANWKRDYFTTCRPQPQLGPEVVIPLTGDLPVKGISTLTTPGSFASAAGAGYNDADGAAPGSNWTAGAVGLAGINVKIAGDNATGNPQIYADPSGASAIDIRDQREANAVQRTLEFNNTFGGRYIEQIMARFGVRVPDYRLDRPELLGTGETKIQFSEVLATTQNEDADIGDMKGHGISLLHSNRYRTKVVEHGWVFAFMVVRPKTQYMQGLHRSWSRESKYDFLLPEFVHIGDQSVLKKELYAAAANPDEVFGFNQMYEEYRTIPSRVAGEFRDQLNFWHMAIEYQSEPSLNSTFVTCTPTTRIYPVTNADQLYASVNHTILARRALPKYQNPKLL